MSGQDRRAEALTTSAPGSSNQHDNPGRATGHSMAASSGVRAPLFPSYASADELDLDSIALHYRVKEPGDSVSVGDVVCFSIEDEPSGRIVGFLRDSQPGMKIVVRCFAAGDGWIPTGDYRRCGLFWPWQGHAKARREAEARHAAA